VGPQFPKLTARHIADPVPGWANETLKDGALVLIDGVDEIPTAHREKLYDWIAELVDLYESSRFVVTSRPYATPKGWLKRLQFHDLTMAPMRGAEKERTVANLVAWSPMQVLLLLATAFPRLPSVKFGELPPLVRASEEVKTAANSELRLLLFEHDDSKNDNDYQTLFERMRWGHSQTSQVFKWLNRLIVQSVLADSHVETRRVVDTVASQLEDAINRGHAEPSASTRYEYAVWFMTQILAWMRASGLDDDERKTLASILCVALHAELARVSMVHLSDGPSPSLVGGSVTIAGADIRGFIPVMPLPEYVRTSYNPADPSYQEAVEEWSQEYKDTDRKVPKLASPA
jgi:hypothetical protein